MSAKPPNFFGIARRAADPPQAFQYSMLDRFYTGARIFISRTEDAG